MADFEAVLRKTLDGMTNPTPEAREKVYERARATITRQIEALPKRPSETAVQRQYEKLEDAIALIEQEYEVPEPEPAPEPAPEPKSRRTASRGVGELDELFEEELARRAREDKQGAQRAEPPLSAEARKPATPGPDHDPLADFLAEQEAVTRSGGRPERIEQPKPVDPVREPRGRKVRMAPPSPSRGNLPLIGAAVAVLLVAGIAGYAGYSFFFSSAPSPNEIVGEDQGATPPPDAPADTADAAGTGDEADNPPKFTQRLTPDGREVDEGPAQSPGTEGEGTSVAGQSDADQQAQTEQPPQDDNGGAGAQAGLPVAQRAIFYQERTGTQAGTAQAGETVWSVVQESPGGDLPPEPAIRAEATIPDLGLKMEMTIRRNADDTFPASHVIELLFRLPDGFEGRGVADVQRITFKGTEQDPGNALIGVAAPLDTNIFMIALTDAKTAIETNLNLMRRQQWIDIPMQYVSGRRALITLEKGIPGDQVFNDVLASWSEPAQN